MVLSISGGNYMGNTISLSGTQIFQTFSCREQQENEEIFHQITPEELAQTIEKASNCEETYALLSIERRKQFLQELMLLLEEHRPTLIAQFIKESSLTEERGNSELTRSITQIQTYLDFISKENWNQVSEEEFNQTSYQKKLFPIGTVVVFGASNFPFAYSTLGGDVISALAAGNPVIYKANPYHAGVSELSAQLILKAAKRAHLPDGVFSLVQGNEYWIGEHLLRDERIHAVGFTGSIKGGVALLNYAKKRTTPIPVFCEMGSLNPTFIMESALINRMDELIERLSFAILNDAGQFCTKPGLIFVEGTKAKEFIDRMKVIFQNSAPIPMLHPTIYDSYQRLIQQFEPQQLTTNKLSTVSYHASPTLCVMTLENFMQSDIAKEEVFGPFSVIVQCDDINATKEAMRMIGGHLTASVWSETEISEEWLYLLSKNVGRVIKNGVSTGVAVIDSMHHGGNFPATSDARFTAVGKDAIYRFLKPVTWQGVKS